MRSARRLRALRALAIAGVLGGAAAATPAAAVQVGVPGISLHRPTPAAESTAASSATAQQVARHSNVRVDRAGYVATTPVDPYRGDRSAIHVAVAVGQQLSRGYLRVDTRHLPAHAQLATLRLTAPTVVGSPIGGANLTLAAPIVEACVTTATVPSTLTAADAPAYDCSLGSSVGKVVDGGAAWTFPLNSLTPYWQRHGDTGLALVPIASSPVATWSAAFSVRGMVATVDQLVRPVAGSAAAPSPRATRHHSSPAPSALGHAAVHFHSTVTVHSSPPIAQSAPAPVVVNAQTRLVAQSTNDHDVLNAWPWILALCVLIAIGSISVAHRALIADELKRDVPPIIAAIRTHPRSYAVAAAALAWGLVFTGYAVVNNDVKTMPARYLGQPAVSGSQSGSSTLVPAPGSTPPTAARGGRSHASGGGAASAPAGVVGSNQTATSPSSNPTATEFTGKGHWETISGTRVFFPAHGVPTADLYHGSADRIGITARGITLCAHAALTYGSAFDIGAKDLNVYWDWLNAHGGVFGRKVSMTYNNDNYDPTTAVQAAQKCKDSNPFFLIGGIGFDQIPAVRQWAEQNKMLYLYHDATVNGSKGLQYSFTALPSVEALGKMFAELDLKQFRGKKIGILYRQSPNWQPGSDAFIQAVKSGGGDIVASLPVQNNQANYVNDLVQLHSKGAQVVFAWENALATTEMIRQAEGLNWHPSWLVFPFNLETDTLGQASFSQPLWGVASWDAYDPFDHGGTFRPYAALMTEFERQYKQYDPSAHLSGDGGDLLFLNWEGQAFIAYLLQKCGPDCTRNRLAGMLLAGFSYTTPPACPIDFGVGDHHHGGATMNVFKVIRDPKNRPNWAPVKRCITSY